MKHCRRKYQWTWKKIAVEDILKFRDKYTEKTNGTSATGCQYEAV